MASRLISLLAIAASIASVLTEPPVRLSERHLRAIPQDHLQYQQQNEDVDNGWQDSVPGLPGRDYPNLTTIPETSFTCAGKTPGGYYADVETRCQVFHVCSTQGSKSSFLCPSGSIFNQRHFVCDWWYDFVCEHALELYSLNDALNDPESSTDPSPKDDRDRYNQLPLAPVQFNSLAGPNGDLSLASSGYTNNLRDEANLIYEDYSNGKIAVDSSSSSSISKQPAAKEKASGTVDNYSADGRRKDPGRLNEQQTSYYGSNYEAASTTTATATSNAQTATYRTRRPNQDIVPRGFSKSPDDQRAFSENRDFRRNNQGPGLFVNNGLSENAAQRDQNNNQNVLPRENNFIVTNNYRKYNENDNRNYNNNNNNHNQYNNRNFNDKSNYNSNFNENYNRNYNANNDSNNYSNYNANNNNRYEDNYQNSENYALAQENSNYVSNSFEKSDVKNYQQSSENNYYNTIRIYSSERYNNANSNNTNYNANNEASVNKYQNANNYNGNYNAKTEDSADKYNSINNYNNNYNAKNEYSTDKYDNSNSNYNNYNRNEDNNNSNYNNNNNVNQNNYNNNNNINQNDYNNNNNINQNNFNNNNYNQKTNNNNSYNNKYQQNYNTQESPEYTTVSKFDFPEDQYEGGFEATTSSTRTLTTSPLEDEVDRERQREVDSADLKRQRVQYDYPAFLIREESSSPNTWRDDLSTSSSGSRSPPYPPDYPSSRSPSLSTPEEPTTPVQQPTTTSSPRSRASKFLGRRPPGGLPSGPGNGLPGAKNLAASNSVTGRPIADDSKSANDANNGLDANAAWADGGNYVPQQGYADKGNGGAAGNGDFGYAAAPDGQYWNNGNGGQWNDAARY